MLSRLLAFLVLCALVGAGLLLWRSGRDPGVDELAGVPDALRERALAGAVETAFHLNRRLRLYDIRVTGEGDAVTLGGAVPSAELSERAARVAAAVPGVGRVVNELEVVPDLPEPPPPVERSAGERVDDLALELRARLAFALDRELDGTDLQVSSYRGELTVAGEVSRAEQRERALRTAADLAGAAEVVDRIRVRESGAATDGRDAVADALAASPALAAYAIRVEADAGRLVLRGRVASLAEKELAGALARSAAQVTVANELETGTR